MNRSRPCLLVLLSLSACLLVVLAGLALLREEASNAPSIYLPERPEGKNRPLLIVGNSLLDSFVNPQELGKALFKDDHAVDALIARGGGRVHMAAMLHSAVTRGTLHPRVIVVYLPAPVWRSAELPRGDDRARLLSVLRDDDPLVGPALASESPLRVLGEPIRDAARARRDRLLHGLTAQGARITPRRHPGQSPRASLDEAFNAIFPDWTWSPVEVDDDKLDPDWVQDFLRPLHEGLRTSGAELWLAEPILQVGVTEGRFSAKEREEIRDEGCGVVDTLALALPDEALSADGHVGQRYAEEVSRAWGDWLARQIPGLVGEGR